jgi:hypothetical protein
VPGMSIEQAPPLPPEAASPQVVYLPQQRSSALGPLLAGLLLAILVLTMAVAAALFLLVASVTGWGGRTVSDAGQRLATTARSATDALG